MILFPCCRSPAGRCIRQGFSFAGAVLEAAYFQRLEDSFFRFSIYFVQFCRQCAILCLRQVDNQDLHAYSAVFHQTRGR
ncbi:hypothetical protein SELSPUOL_01413 [Selenomonas sputigena ATCC 35185]|uniref:Uncharacterized protein n=1 Tax=Selenomonas sputigena (strain ATCC 35185 / DSM 20758 / CCUG 44933 / VPI D19B-28) TaxID=546271 RepID=C9LVC0_SELS3|nr:hypothetical protein SELSPUOL_01413 [Selenomonas sputigena ATCC 35185]